MRWYVLRAMSGRETQCREQIAALLRVHRLEDRVKQMLIPVERVTEVKRGKKVTSERKLYPGYIYVEAELDQQLIDLMRSVEGVGGFLGADPRHPDPLSPEEAERIVRIATAATPDEQRRELVQIPFKVDDRIKVKEGTFAGMEGVVKEINPSKGEVQALITVFGRQTPVWLEVWQVEPAV
ncbi:MAG: transcription termination/antitermination protein NusG [Planctomycetota bacterium]|nr:transcription termination/antitermination protein NusG [Planctomycetota bacterium]MDW8372498.1 transcription termination/antitermination protein NusG [Planctomycetota bacterium]